MQQAAQNKDLSDDHADCVELTLAGETFLAGLEAILFWPRHRCLIVADLHLEKGSSFARTGQFLPPYDSRKTLARLFTAIAQFKPDHVICLGDSFHDTEGSERLEADLQKQIRDATSTCRWTWITGNHDPDAPLHLGGEAAGHLIFDGIGFCHHPGDLLPLDVVGENSLKKSETKTDVIAEISGHLHPVATLKARGRGMRRRCFVLNKDRLILPAFGAYTGGLNVGQPAFADIVGAKTQLAVLGQQRIRLLPYHAPSMAGRR